MQNRYILLLALGVVIGIPLAVFVRNTLRRVWWHRLLGPLPKFSATGRQTTAAHDNRSDAEPWRKYE